MKGHRMNGQDSSVAAWSLPAATRTRLIALLVAGTDNPTPLLTPEQAMTALCEARADYFNGEALRDKRNPPTPARSRHAINTLLGQIKRFELLSDADTVAVARPGLEALSAALEDRRDVLQAWALARDAGWTQDNNESIRKTDARTENIRILCGFVWRIWQGASHDPDNVTAWRNFTTAFLIAAECWSADDRHPERIDAWRLTPVEPMTQEANHAAATEARDVFAKLAPK